MGGIHTWVVREFWGSGRYTYMGCKGHPWGSGRYTTWIVMEFWGSGRYTYMGCKGVLG